MAIRFFSEVRLSSASKTDAGAAFIELADKVKDYLGYLDPAYFGRLAQAMKKWVEVWEKRKNQRLKLVPSRSSTKPSPDASCAVFTVTHNEPHFLPLWIEHYAQHAERADMWILDHGSDDGSTDKLWKDQDARLAGSIHVQRLSEGGPHHYLPHIFLNRAIETHHSFLLRQGYKCVVFAEIDEFLVADPDLFLGGFKQYMRDFATKDQRDAVRASGKNVVQSKGEAPMDWSRPVLEQRSRWRKTALYGKPVITKVPLSYSKKAAVTVIDEGLQLVNMKSADKDMCEKREFRR